MGKLYLFEKMRQLLFFNHSDFQNDFRLKFLNMKKYSIFLLIFWMTGTSTVFSQQNYSVKKGSATATSETVIATIVTKNSNIIGALDLKKGSVSFQMEMNEFQFKSRLMKEHFNDWFVESEIYPTANFSGKIDISKLDLEKNQRVELIGFLEFHGAIKKVSTIILLEKKGTQLTASGEYTLKLDDFNIEIPTVLSVKLANEIKVKINLDFEASKSIVRQP